MDGVMVDEGGIGKGRQSDKAASDAEPATPRPFAVTREDGAA
jgi:hypothetical protein